MPPTRRTAYWTRQPQQPLDRSVCWRAGCTQPATEHQRWIGAYCEPCVTEIERDAERETR